MKESVKIAIDGPAGAGKSTIAKIIAEKLRIEYIDSGAFYRAIAKKILDSNIKIDDYAQIEKILSGINLKFEDNKYIINNEDVTPFLRTKEVTLVVSPVSSNISVRKKVNRILNEYSIDKSVIMDGRDIGTVVFPDADYKFYLDASIEERAKRRFDENTLNLSFKEIKEAIRKRDENDKNKEFGALKVADNAIFIDTTNLSINEVVDKIIEKININGVLT